jgi:hypothetical protein
MDDIPIIGLREFRLETTKVDVPTRVVASKPIRSIGLWIPDGYRVEGRIVKKEPEREKP